MFLKYLRDKYHLPETVDDKDNISWFEYDALIPTSSRLLHLKNI